MDELIPGDLVPSATNGILTVSALEWTDRAEIVYNFGVDEFHTYFVGESGAWVHNCLPSWKQLKVELDHILSGHRSGGGRVASNTKKTLFPDYMSEKNILQHVREAYKDAKRMSTQGDRVQLRGKSADFEIEMWLNTATNTLESAYPRY